MLWFVLSGGNFKLRAILRDKSCVDFLDALIVEHLIKLDEGVRVDRGHVSRRLVSCSDCIVNVFVSIVVRRSEADHGESFKA